MAYEHLSGSPMHNVHQNSLVWHWDDTCKGTDLPVGSYYFIIEMNDSSNKSETGTISIILNKVVRHPVV